MSRRDSFFAVLFGTTVLILLAQSTEYRGFESLSLAGFLTVASVVGTLACATLAIRSFEAMHTAHSVVAAGCCAILPFVVDWFLSVNHTSLNVHGAAILGYFFYALGLWITAAGLLIATAVRAARSK